MIKKARLTLVTTSALLLAACTPATPTVTNNQAQNAGTGNEQTQSTNIRDLLALGKNQKCTVTISETSEEGVKTDTQGTLYFSGQKMAEDISITSTDKNMPKTSMRMISDGSYMYSWNPETKINGMKFKVTEPTTEDTKTTTSNAQASGVNMDQKYDMKCSDWTVDNSVFAIPTDVTFTDLSEMLKKMPSVPTVPPVQD